MQPHSTVQTLQVLLQDRPGALHRVVTLFRRRGYNIDSLHVERAEVADVSRMRVAIDAPGSAQVISELERLVEVLSVRDVTRQPAPPTTTLVSSRTQADGACDEMGAI